MFYCFFPGNFAAQSHRRGAPFSPRPPPPQQWNMRGRFGNLSLPFSPPHPPRLWSPADLLAAEQSEVRGDLHRHPFGGGEVRRRGVHRGEWAQGVGRFWEARFGLLVWRKIEHHFMENVVFNDGLRPKYHFKGVPEKKKKTYPCWKGTRVKACKFNHVFRRKQG